VSVRADSAVARTTTRRSRTAATTRAAISAVVCRYALSGSPDVSLRKGWEALTVEHATGSRRITTELGQLGSRLTHWESRPEVCELLKELPAA
jgi:hypothetical protein